jgi:hypothetical protein
MDMVRKSKLRTQHQQQNGGKSSSMMASQPSTTHMMTEFWTS